jgi:hypothetical protein
LALRQFENQRINDWKKLLHVVIILSIQVDHKALWGGEERRRAPGGVVKAAVWAREPGQKFRRAHHIGKLLLQSNRRFIFAKSRQLHAAEEDGVVRPRL